MLYLLIPPDLSSGATVTLASVGLREMSQQLLNELLLYLTFMAPTNVATADPLKMNLVSWPKCSLVKFFVLTKNWQK